MAFISQDAGTYTLQSGEINLEVRTDKADDSIDIWTNTAKDGSGTQYNPIVDADGKLFTAAIVAHDAAVPSYANVIGYEYKDFDGTALPNNVGAEADAVRAAGTAYGVGYVKLVNEDGSLGLDNIEDTAHASGDLGVMALAIRNDVLAVLTTADGDYAGLQVNDIGALFVTGEHREDDAHVTLDYGHQVLGVRNDVLASLCDTDGDYTPFQVNDIGAVFVTGEHVEDAAHASGDYGHFVLSVRNDALAALATTDGDYAPFQVNDIGALFVTGEHAEDAAHASGDYGHAVWAVRNDILASLVDTDGDYAPFQVDPLGALYTATSAQADLETTHHTTASATATGTVASIDGYTMALVHVVEDTGGWDRTGTYTIQASPDGGTTYKNIDLWDVENGRALAGAALTIAASDNRSFLIDLRGMDKLRVNLSVTVAGTTGTVTITSRAIPISDSVLHAMSQGSDGSAVPPGMMLVGGSDGTNLEALQVCIDNATASATPNVLMVGGSYKSSVDTYADNDAAPLLMTDKGILATEITSGQNLTPIFDTNAHAGFIEITDGTNEVAVIATILSLKSDLSSVAGTVTDVNSGNKSAGSQRVVLATDDVNASAIKTAVELIDDAIYVDDADWTNGSSKHALVGGIYQSTPQSITDGDTGPIQLDSNGRPLIGQVIPGTGATDLGKAIDSAVGSTDTGIALLGQHASDTTHLSTAEGDYDVMLLSEYGALHVSPEQHHIFDSLDATTGWTALSNDTLNLATTKKHVLGTDALTFDKVDGAANTVFAAIQKTLTSVDLGNVSPHDLIQTACYLPTLTDVDYVFIRLGTDSSNYNEWRIEDDALTAATYVTLIFNVGDANYTGITGNGWDPTAITYICIGVAFDAETDALAGIIFDEISFHTNQHTSTELTAEVSSSISSANVNLQKVGGSATDKNAGNASNGSQRVVIATDDVNMAAIKTSVELIDDAVAAEAAAATKGVQISFDDGTDTQFAQCDASGNLKIVPGATTADGADMLFDADGDNTAQVCKAAAGNVYSIEVSNSNSADAWIQFFNVAAGSVTVGTTTPNQSYFVPAFGAMDKSFAIPLTFGTAITYACTTTPTGNGDPTTGLVVNIGYK